MKSLTLIRINLTRRAALKAIKWCRRQQQIHFIGGFSEKEAEEIAGICGAKDTIVVIEHILLYWTYRHMEMSMLAINTLCKIQKMSEYERN